MRAILINDFVEFKSFFKRSFLIFFVPFLTFILILYSQDGIQYSSVLNIMSLNIDLSDFIILDVALYVLCLFMHIYLAYSLFYNDIKKGSCNLLLRINLKKWLLCKLFSIIIFNLIFFLLTFSVFYIYCYMQNYDFEVIWLFKYYLYFLDISLLIILLFHVFEIRYNIILVLLFLIGIFVFDFVNIVEISLILLVALFIFIVLALYFMLKNTIYKVFENLF